MQIGLVGLGKMGGNMRTRLRKGGVEVTGYDPRPEISDVPSLEAMVAALPAPRVVWIMVPSGEPTRQIVGKLGALLSDGDLIIEGGNSRFSDDILHAQELARQGVGYLDCGVSGGVWGLENGYGLMVGGDAGWSSWRCRCSTRCARQGPREEGFVHAGEVGAGHYAKMVHNGIEYGMMQAYAEGYELLAAKDIVADVPGTLEGLDPRHRGAFLAAGPPGPGARGGPGAGRHPRLRRRLRRGPLDGGGGDRQRGTDAGDHRVPVRPVRAPGSRTPRR